ncbi:MAG TPA: FtsX-like permease family protein [Solirubrobacteraceae bacterium]|jgi:putative ABC transport system permease protein|nr:FtsX-like permease family protein [Solirubrobacteraceae bacterium]
MRLGTILYLYRVRLRARLVQELLAVAGIGVGVALLFASQVANTSLTGSVVRLTNDLVGNATVQIVARDPHGFDEAMLARVQALAGVRLAVPVLERQVRILGARGGQDVDLIGVNTTLLALHSPLLAHISPEQMNEQKGLAVPASVAGRIGARPLTPVTLQIGARDVQTTIALPLQESDVGSAADSPIAIARLGEAQQLTGMADRIDRVLVEPQRGRDALVTGELHRLAGPGLSVRPADFDATVFQQAEGPAVESTELFSAISALVGFLFAFNAMLITVPQRRNLIADLRLDGYASHEIAQVMLFDVLALGAVGSLVGLALGDALSHSLLQAQPGYLSLAFPVGSVRVVSVASILIAAAGGLLAAVLGVVFPLRREIFTGSASELSTSAPRASAGRRAPGALLGGVLCIGLSTTLLLGEIENVSAATFAFFSLTLALLLTLPMAFTAVIGLIDRMQRPVLGVSSRIAMIELLSRTTRSRSLAIAATGAIAVYGSVAVEGAHQDLRDGLERAAAAVSLGTDLWVTPTGSATTLATTPFENRYAAAIRSRPAVLGVADYRGGFLDVGDRRVLVLGPPRSNPRLVSADQVIRGDPGLASFHLREGGWLTVSRELATELGLRVGTPWRLPSPAPRTFRVAAITTNFGWSPGAIVMSSESFARAWGDRDVSAYQVLLRHGQSLSGGLSQVRSALGSSALVVQTASRHQSNEIAGQRQGLARLTAIAALVLLAAALAMAAAIGAMLWQRRGRLAGMKVDGFDEKELWGALLWESLMLLAIGCSIGALFGLYGQVLLDHALVSVAGFPVAFSAALWLAVATAGIVTAIALLVVAVPGYLAVRVSPALQD